MQIKTTNRKHLARKESERGQSLVELAVSLMLIIFVLAGAVDMGRAYFSVISMRDAVQEGVIFASANPKDISTIEDRVRYSSTGPLDFTTFPSSDIIVSWNIGGTEYTEASPPSEPCAGFYDNAGTTESNWIDVRLEYQFPFATPVISALFPSGLRLAVHDRHTILAPECP
jgi:hypothetical protein